LYFWTTSSLTLTPDDCTGRKRPLDYYYKERKKGKKEIKIGSEKKKRKGGKKRTGRSNDAESPPFAKPAPLPSPSGQTRPLGFKRKKTRTKKNKQASYYCFPKGKKNTHPV